MAFTFFPTILTRFQPRLTALPVLRHGTLTSYVIIIFREAYSVLLKGCLVRE